MTAPTSCGDTPERPNASRAAVMPRSVGETCANAPLQSANGVRTPSRSHTSLQLALRPAVLPAMTPAPRSRARAIAFTYRTRQPGQQPLATPYALGAHQEAAGAGGHWLGSISPKNERRTDAHPDLLEDRRRPMVMHNLLGKQVIR